MKRILATLCLLCMVTPAFAAGPSLHKMKVKTLTGETYDFSQLKGKVVLFVNTASPCGYTDQYKGLQSLYQKYQGRGLVVFGFPSNQFGRQEPGSNKQIKEFCDTSYSVTFPMAAKSDVNGPSRNPVYRNLLSQTDDSSDIRWNFEKILVNKKGRVVKRFMSDVEPESDRLVQAIEGEL